MSPKVSATYRIKLQIYLTLNLAFKKAGPNRPGRATKICGLHRLPSPKLLQRGRQSLSQTGTPRTYPLGMVLEACPDILDFAPRRNFVLARSRRDSRNRSKSDRRFARRLGAGARGLGRARRLDRHCRDPAAR